VLIPDAHQHKITGGTWIEFSLGGIQLAVSGRIGRGRVPELGNDPNVNGGSSLTVTLEDAHPLAQGGLELRGRNGTALGLASANEAAGLLDSRFHCGVDEENDPKLKNRENHEEERQGNDGEFNRSCAFAGRA
jgi:hypothetical protein